MLFRRRHRRGAAIGALLALDDRLLDDAGYARWALELESAAPDGPNLARARRRSRGELAHPWEVK